MSFPDNTRLDWSHVPPSFVDAYDRLDSRFRGVYSKSARRLAELAHLGPGNTVIDLGCGTGTSTAVVWKSLAFSGRVVGLDVSPEMIERAKSKVSSPHVRFLLASSYKIRDISAKLGLIGETDVVLSNFAYHYIKHNRKALHKHVCSILREGGTWVFNRTPYLSTFEHDGHLYNGFSVTFLKALDRVLEERRILAIRTPIRHSQSYHYAHDEMAILAQAGFSRIRVETWSLPITPSEAVRLTIDGFYRFGAEVTLHQSLQRIQLKERIELLTEALNRSSVSMDSSGQRPYILNVVATK